MSTRRSVSRPRSPVSDSDGPPSDLRRVSWSCPKARRQGIGSRCTPSSWTRRCPCADSRSGGGSKSQSVRSQGSGCCGISIPVLVCDALADRTGCEPRGTQVAARARAWIPGIAHDDRVDGDGPLRIVRVTARWLLSRNDLGSRRGPRALRAARASPHWASVSGRQAHTGRPPGTGRLWGPSAAQYAASLRIPAAIFSGSTMNQSSRTWL